MGEVYYYNLLKLIHYLECSSPLTDILGQDSGQESIFGRLKQERRTFSRYFVCSWRAESEHMDMGSCLRYWFCQVADSVVTVNAEFLAEYSEPFNVNY